MARAKRTDNKGRVLRVGEQQRSEDGRYLFRYSDLGGKKRTVYANTLVELREKEEQIQRDLQDGIETSDMTVNELFRVYMDARPNLRGTTIKNYDSMWRNTFQETLGNIKLSKIKQIHVTSLIAEMEKNGAAARTIRVNLNLLSSVMEMAVESDLIRKNPCRGCGKYITGTKNERRALTRAEQAAFINYVNTESKYKNFAPMYAFMLATGLRIGELTGLRWSDVDFSENVVHVRQQLIYSNFGDGYRYHIQALKTRAGYRDIPLTEDARKSLIRQRELSLMLGWETVRKEIEGVSDFVFINREGKPHSTSALNQKLYRIVDSYNAKHEEKLPHISAHILRHTFCSRMAEAGLDVKTLQYVMGHSDIGITLNTYTHLDFSTVQENMKEIQSKVLVG